VPGPERTPGLTYRDAGVDIAAGERAVELIKDAVRSTTDRPEVLGDIGGFGGLFALDVARYREPVLVSGTDTAGTKMLVALETGRLDTIGIDVVAMCVDDIAVAGAQPLFFLDCISVSHLDPEQIRSIVAGVADGCRQAGCALIGGEMAEVQGLLAPGHIDVAGFAVGVVDRAALLPAGIAPGDRLVGLASPGLRSNGYSLARRALLEAGGRSLDHPAWAGAGHSLADELLRPSVVYAPLMAQLRSVVEVHGFAHITGGGLAGNLARVLPPDCDAVVHRSAWPEPLIFNEIRQCGAVAEDEMEQVFNLGVGMVAVVPADQVTSTLSVTSPAGSWEIGEVQPGTGAVTVLR
jgi:phosphoribosylformylglycinamidine cyclo-ligase